VGLRYALATGADYLMLLNNDTEADPALLEQLVGALEADPTIGAVGPTIYYHGRAQTIWSAGGLIDWRRGTSHMRGLDELDEGQYQANSPVDFVTGCALLVRRAAVEQVGLLDDRFFMYYEEAEWCVRMTRAGYRIVHVPAARLWHKIDPERQAATARIAYYMARNRLLFLRLTRATPAAWLHAALLQDLRTCLSLSLRPRWRGRRKQRDALLRAWRDFWAGRFGQVTI
jgi:GT2 family glycosyltransferase